MTRIRTTSVAFVATLALGSFASAGSAAAFADGAAPAPCATQLAQYDRASATFDTLAATFAAHPTMKNLKAKKAQVQRRDRALTRLTTCQNAQAG